MNLDELKEKIKIAHEAVSDESEPYKIESFKIILKILIIDYLSEKQGVERRTGKVSTGTEKISTGAENISTNLAKLAANCELTVDELEEVITIEHNEVEIIVNITGNEAEQQVTAAKCVLITHETVFKQDWMKTSTIKESLRKSGIQDKSSHLSEYLQRQSTLFRMRGKGSGAEYKLTTQGRTSAYQTIRKLAKGE